VPDHASRRGTIAAQCFRFRLPPRHYSTANDIIIDRYEDLPQSYTDKEGLPFRKTDLSSSEVKRIFGPGIKTSAANRLLRILHGRRVAGTLDDPAYHGNTSTFSQDDKNKALVYLRRTTEVDELLNAGLRAEDELRELELEAAGEGDHLDDPVAAKLANRKPDPVYGDSVFDDIRARNIAKREERERIEAEERAEQERLRPGPLARLDDKPRELSPRMQKWMEQGTSDLDAPPELTHFERLLPSTALVALFVITLAGIAAIYTPPGDHDRLFPEVSPAYATVGALVALNLAVHLAWRIPPLWGLLNRYFILVHGAPKAPTVLTSVFSHQYFLWHLVPNMLGLCAIGPALHDDIGRAGFLAVYLASGAVGFLGSLYWFTLRGVLTSATIGASGAVYGIFTGYFWLHRFDSFKVLNFPPDPLDGPQGLVFIALALALHIWGVTRKGAKVTDYPSHLAGMATGLAGVHILTGGRGRLTDPAAVPPGGRRSRVEFMKDVQVTKLGSGPRPAA
jgi:rhomboid-like protein